MEEQCINIVWFKRDLRFIDHEPLFFAQQSQLPINKHPNWSVKLKKA